MICVGELPKVVVFVPSTSSCAPDVHPGKFPKAAIKVFGAADPIAKLAALVNAVTVITEETTRVTGTTSALPSANLSTDQLRPVLDKLRLRRQTQPQSNQNGRETTLGNVASQEKGLMHASQCTSAKNPVLWFLL